MAMAEPFLAKFMKDHLLVFIPGIMGTELIYRGPGEFKETITERVGAKMYRFCGTP
jgi:hypothetical protein